MDEQILTTKLSDDLDVDGLAALVDDLEGDADTLTGLKLLYLEFVEKRLVHEHVFHAIVRNNETKAFINFVPFHKTAHGDGAVFTASLRGHQIHFTGVNDFKDFLDLLAFRAIINLAQQDCAFADGVQACLLQCRDMKEGVEAFVIGNDEAEPFRAVKPFQIEF